MTVDELKSFFSERIHDMNQGKVSEFHFGEFINTPDNEGVFQLNGKWFLYSTDERNVKDITGPFGDSEVVYACAVHFRLSKYYKEYKFGDDAMNIYLYSHYRSLKEALESIG